MPNASAQRLQRVWQSRGPFAVAGLPLALLFGLVVVARRALYRLGLFRTERLPVPVVVVGNVIAGGAGKTPTVIAAVQALRRAGYTPAVISRGYGRKADAGDSAAREVDTGTAAAQSGDEPLLVRRRTGAPVAVCRDRVAAARLLLDRHPAVDVIVSDDGLQHLRLPRAAQIIVFDERGAGNGWLLPAGPLREPLMERVPPRSLVLYNAPQPSTPLPGALARRALAGVAPLADWHAGAAPSREALESLRRSARPILAVAGTARPERFFAMLRAEQVDIAECPLPDHYDYDRLPWAASTAEVIVTEKDAVKIAPDDVGSTRVWVATLDFVLPPEFESALLALLPAPRAARSA